MKTLAQPAVRKIGSEIAIGKVKPRKKYKKKKDHDPFSFSTSKGPVNKIQDKRYQQHQSKANECSLPPAS